MQLFLLGICGLASFADAAAANLPVVFEMISTSMVEYAVANRSPNYPSPSASNAAKRIVDGVIAAPQFTSFFEVAENIVFKDGETMVPSDVLKLAQSAHSAYSGMKASSGFSNYLHYVSAQAKHFDVKKMFSPPDNQRGAQMSAQIQQALTDLEKTADGRAAVQSIDSLVEEIEHDVGVSLPRRYH